MKRRIIKIMALIAALAVLSCLAACGTDPGGTITPKDSATPTPTAEAEQEPEFSVGGVSGNVYTNKFLGIGCELDSSWHINDEEEIKELNSSVMSVLDGDFAKQAEAADYFYDMVAAKTDSTANINIILTKLSLKEALLTDIEASVKQGLEEARTGYENMGYTDYNYVIGKAEFVGKQQVCAHITAKINGIDLNAKQITFIKGNYSVSVTVTTFINDTCDDILSMFYALK